VKFSIEIKGGEELAKNLDKLSIAPQKRIVREALRAGAEPMRLYMEQQAPRGDPAAPNLAQSMAISSAMPIEGDIATVKVGPTRDVHYGRFQEFGTARHSAQPFMRPAFDSKAEQSVRIVQNELWRLVVLAGVHDSARTAGGGIGDTAVEDSSGSFSPMGGGLL
jgi:HK97 gp10 family phage protein